MRGEMNWNRYEISFRLKIFNLVFSQLFTCVHMNAVWNSNRYGFHIGHFDRNEILNRHEIFMWTKFTRSEMNKLSLVGYCVRMRVWNSFKTHRNKISFRVIKYHVNTTRNETPTHVRLYIGSFWNAAEMKSHVKRTCFHAGLKSQTGMSSFRLSCERTLRYYEQTFSNFSITL